MTKQAPDKVLHKGQEFIIAGLKGSGLFEPRHFGISDELIGIATACYRGYFSKYTCDNEKLFLVEYSIIQTDNTDLPTIEGISAKSENVLFSCYKNLKLPCFFSGGLIIVRNSIGLVGHFPSPLEFDEVYEIIFEQGMLRDEVNHSETVARLRDSINDLRTTLESKGEMSEILRKWVSPNEKVSDQERDIFGKYINEVAQKKNRNRMVFRVGL